jgi:hypothetical protein
MVKLDRISGWAGLTGWSQQQGLWWRKIGFQEASEFK